VAAMVTDTGHLLDFISESSEHFPLPRDLLGKRERYPSLGSFSFPPLNIDWVLKEMLQEEQNKATKISHQPEGNKKGWEQSLRPASN